MCINTNWKGRRAALKDALETCINGWFAINQKAMGIELFDEPPDLGSKHALYIDNLADTCIATLEWQYSGSRDLVVDYKENPEPFSDTIDRIKHLCNINKSNVSIKIVSDTGIWYESTDNLYEWLDNYIQCSDCKNGCQIYKAHGQYYFCISGQGLKEIHIYFKELEEW
jgi:hypothetical protein